MSAEIKDVCGLPKHVFLNNHVKVNKFCNYRTYELDWYLNQEF